jgi:hypothetical protein
MNGGTLKLAGNQHLRLATGGTHRLGVTLQWSPDQKLPFRPGDTFTLLPDTGKTEVGGKGTRTLCPLA